MKKNNNNNKKIYKKCMQKGFIRIFRNVTSKF